MKRFRQTALLAMTLAIALPGSAGAQSIRRIDPVQQSMLPPASDDGKKRPSDPAGLKPRSEEVPSPILVERVATIGPDGGLTLGCAAARKHDFRTPRRHASKGETR